MVYTLDTNVLVAYVRENASSNFLEAEYQLFSPENTAILPIVVIAEIYALAAKNNWGERRLSVLARLIEKAVIVEIDNSAIINMYIDIEKINYNIHPTITRKGSTVKMGKNDIWIASVAAVSHSQLITSDADYSHLGDLILTLGFFEQRK